MKILSRLIIIIFTSAIVFIYNLTDTTTYEATLNNELSNQIELPIIMYHSFLKDESTHGKFVISPAQFEEDIKYIVDKGYEPILVSDLIDFVENKKTLPQKPIMITIDDGYYNNYLYAFPILKKYNAKAVISPIIKYSELYSNHDENNAYYSHITWSQGREMINSNLIEFQNHTYDLHSIDNGRKGIQKKNTESVENYQKILFADLYKAHNLIKENFEFTPNAITFPFGYYSEEAEFVLKELGYNVSFSSKEGLNTISPTSSLRLLKRYNRPYGKSSADFFANITK